MVGVMTPIALSSEKTFVVSYKNFLWSLIYLVIFLYWTIALLHQFHAYSTNQSTLLFWDVH